MDPALKESAFLTNIFNRLARSCFYGAQNACGGMLPDATPSQEVLDECTSALLDFEQAASVFDAHTALSIAEKFTRDANKRWDSASKADEKKIKPCMYRRSPMPLRSFVAQPY